MAVKTIMFRARKRLVPHLRSFVDTEPSGDLARDQSSNVARKMLKVANV
jgi:hypothetical protein